jgi:hypothetical protein
MMHFAKLGRSVNTFPFVRFFPVNVSPALLQSHRNQIQAAAPFPRKNEEAVRASIL